MASKTPPKAKAAPKAATKKSTVMPLNKSVNFKSPMVLAVIGLFVALGLFFILKTFAAANPYSCPSPSLPMAQGATGNCVKYLQWTLNTYVYKKDVTGGVDGQFGPKTKAAVQGYQYASNTPPVDGVVTATLWNKLKALNGGGGFDPAAVTYYYNSAGIGHSYGKTDNPPGQSQVYWGEFDYKPHTSGKLWFGPYRNMVIPANAHGIRACVTFTGYRPPSDETGTVSFFYDLTANNGASTLASEVTVPAMADYRDHTVCIEKAGSPGQSFSNVEARVGKMYVTGEAWFLSIKSTTLSYY